MTEHGLVLGAGILLAKMGDGDLCLDGEEERILTLLAIAYRGDVPGAALGMFRRVSKHWQGGDKCLAAIHLAQSGLPDIDEDAAYRLSLAAELIEACMTPRELARELGLNPVQFDVSKYDENQPRVPAGNGRASGQWTSGDNATSASATSGVVEGRSAGANAGSGSDKDNHEHYKIITDLPKDAVGVKNPDGRFIDDLHSTTGFLMAPPNADFRRVYAAGQQTAPINVIAIYDSVAQEGVFDYQRDAPNKGPAQR
jgi:hypothetical protein